MDIKTISVTYTKKFNLGNYESLEIGCSLWGQIDPEEDSDGATTFLFIQAKDAVKKAAMPVLIEHGYQIEKDSPEPSSPQQNPAPAPTHPQDLRIRQIRTLTEYSVDLIKGWLEFQGVKFPSQLDVAKVDKLVRHICLSWASDKLERNQAEASYQQQVIGAIAAGVPEIQAVQEWMNYVAGLITPAAIR